MEIWKDIPWYEWKYQASNYWNVKNILTNHILSKRRKNYNKPINDRYFVTLWSHKNAKNYTISRLVASIFLWLDINNKNICVCHKDDNPFNDFVDNLFLWTHRDNMLDMKNKWRWNSAKWENSNLSKLKNEDILNIRYLHSIWKMPEFVCKLYWIKWSTYWQIYKRKTWKHI